MSFITVCVEPCCYSPGRGFEGYCLLHQNYKRNADSEYALRFTNESAESKLERAASWAAYRDRVAKEHRQEQAEHFLDIVQYHRVMFASVLREMTQKSTDLADLHNLCDSIHVIADHVEQYTPLALSPLWDPRPLDELLLCLGIRPEEGINHCLVKQLVTTLLTCTRRELRHWNPEDRSWWIELSRFARTLQTADQLLCEV
jgi:hypothetical protein